MGEQLQSLLKDRRTFALRLKSLGWWNCDAPLPRLALIVGQLTDVNGRPLAAIQVVAKASSYAGWSFAVSDQTGSFQILCSAGSRFAVDTYRKARRRTPDFADPEYLAMAWA